MVAGRQLYKVHSGKRGIGRLIRLTLTPPRAHLRPNTVSPTESKMVQSWQFWALLSAAFAALTAIFAKVGVSGINSDMATFIRTAIILPMTLIIVLAFGNWQNPANIPGKTWQFLTLSALATGASWLCYFRALKLGDAGQVAPIDKLSVVLVAIFAAIFLGERLSIQGWAGVSLIAAGAVLVATA